LVDIELGCSDFACMLPFGKAAGAKYTDKDSGLSKQSEASIK
jgi:hypothetical protein